MKITALIPDEIINQLKNIAGRKTITENLILALKEWISIKKIKQLNHMVDENPFDFAEGFSATNTREINRRS